MRCLSLIPTLLLVLTSWLPVPATAQAGGTGAFLFAYQPHPGQETAFTEGYRSHLEWHREAGDSLSWFGWTVLAGPRIGAFVDGVFGIDYVALDVRVDPAGDAAHMAEHVTPHAEPLARGLVRLRPELSTATPLEERTTTPLSISEMAEATGLSAHTLRYYEDEGLIPRVERNHAGHRRYRDDHVKWVGLLERLRTSGMSIQRMRRYTELAVEGDETLEERKRLLKRHEADIEGRIAELRRCLAIVRAKLDLYEGRLDDPGEVWELVAEAQRRLTGQERPGLRAAG